MNKNGNFQLRFNGATYDKLLIYLYEKHPTTAFRSVDIPREVLNNISHNNLRLILKEILDLDPNVLTLLSFTEQYDSYSIGLALKHFVFFEGGVTEIIRKQNLVLQDEDRRKKLEEEDWKAGPNAVKQTKLSNVINIVVGISALITVLIAGTQYFESREINRQNNNLEKRLKDLESKSRSQTTTIPQPDVDTSKKKG